MNILTTLDGKEVTSIKEDVILLFNHEPILFLHLVNDSSTKLLVAICYIKHVGFVAYDVPTQFSSIISSISLKGSCRVIDTFKVDSINEKINNCNIPLKFLIKTQFYCVLNYIINSENLNFAKKTNTINEDLIDCFVDALVTKIKPRLESSISGGNNMYLLTNNIGIYKSVDTAEVHIALFYSDFEDTYKSEIIPILNLQSCINLDYKNTIKLLYLLLIKVVTMKFLNKQVTYRDFKDISSLTEEEFGDILISKQIL